MRRSQRAVFAAIALLASGFVAWTYAAYRGDMQRARARVSAGSEVAQTRCGPIEYVRTEVRNSRLPAVIRADVAASLRIQRRPACIRPAGS